MVSLDRELEAGSRAHYDDPAYYTATYRSRIEDIQFYVAEALASGGPVLEYGIGNGRIALPIARHGVAVTGVDLSPVMLGDLRERLAREPRDVAKRVRLVQGDMRDARLKKRFALVTCPFNAALHLYVRDDVERFLARVRAHLAPGGKFIVDLSVPHPIDLARDPDRAFKAPRFRHPTAGVVRYQEHFDYDEVRQILFVSMEFEPMADPSRAFTTPLCHSQFHPREWEAFLFYNGFEVERVEGDFQGGALARGCEVMVWHARARRGWRR